MTPVAAIVLAITATPFAMYAAWSDLRFMRLPNWLNLSLAGAFLVVAPFVLPLGDVGVRLGVGVAALVAGIGLHAVGAVGGGDAKYAAALLPFVAPRDLDLFAPLFGTMLLAAFATHRLLGAIGPIRRLTPEWESWRSGAKFPMGLALSGALLFYLYALWVITAVRS